MESNLLDLGAERAVLAGLFSYGLESYVEVSDIIDGKTFYDRITIDPNKVDEHDLFLHAIREGSSYSLVISEKIKTIFEMFAPDDFIFSPLFIEEDNDDEEDDDWGSWN